MKTSKTGKTQIITNPSQKELKEHGSSGKTGKPGSVLSYRKPGGNLQGNSETSESGSSHQLGNVKKEDIIPLVYFPFRKSGGADSGGDLRQSSASCDLWRKNEIFMEPRTRSGGLCCLSDGREGEKADRRYLSSGNCQRSPGGAGGTNQSFLFRFYKRNCRKIWL